MSKSAPEDKPAFNFIQENLRSFDFCPLCQSETKNANKLYQLNYLHIFQCPKCSLKYLNPCLMPETQKKLFSSPDVLSQVSRFLADYFSDGSWETSKTISIHNRVLDQISFLYPNKGKLLDIGCGRGTFLIEAQKKGWQSVGLEPNFDAAETLKKNHQIEVYTADFFDLNIPNATFDVISLWDLIEHTPNPLLWFERCLSLLKPGGLLVMATPNHHSFLDFVADTAYRLTLKRFTLPLKQLYTADHTLYLTGQTLGDLFKRSGFQVVSKIKVNTDLSRYKMSPGFRLVSETLLAISSILYLHNRMIMIGKKD